MESRPFAREAIVLREKKLNMTLDDIIKMSKTNTAKTNRQKDMNKRSRNFSGNQDKTQKMQHYMNSRSTLRKGFFAQKRLGFQASESTRKTTVIPFHGRAVNLKNNSNSSQRELYFPRVPLRRLVPSDPQLFLWKSRPSGPLRRKQGNISNVRNTRKWKSTSKMMNRMDESSIWSLLEEMEVDDHISAHAFCFLVRDRSKIKAILASPARKRNEVLKIFMETS